MALTREQFKDKVTAILGMTTPENQASASEILTELTDEYGNIMTESETHAGKVQELTKNNETLRDVNAKLFLKVGATVKETHKEETPATEEPVTELTYEKLFNEKGELI